MKWRFMKRLSVVGGCCMLGTTMFAADLGAKSGTGTTNEEEAQIAINCQLLEMPSATVKSFFGAQGAVPGSEVNAEVLQKLAQSKEVDVVSAPRVTSRPGQSAQIKVCEQRSFATNFKVMPNGAWEPVFTPTDIGLTMTVVANPYPNDPERLRGVAEILLSRLVSVNEQKVTPPGQKEPFTLQLPVVDGRVLTTAFNVNSGKTVVLGSLDRTDGDKAKSTVVLLMVASTSPGSELVGKLKTWIIPDVEFEEAAMPQVQNFLIKKSQELDPQKKGVNILLQGPAQGAIPKVTLALKNIPMYDAIRYIALASNTTAEYGQNTLIIRIP
jgi:hypothetical protein